MFRKSVSSFGFVVTASISHAARATLIILGLGMSGFVARAQASPSVSSSPLGRGHLWVKGGQIDLNDAAGDAWGVDHETYLALEGYGGGEQGFYLGGEIGRFGAGATTTASGDDIRDLGFLWLEMNGKKAFDLNHGLTVDLGLGWALFYVDGEEVSQLDGQEFTDPLADVGLGAQVFADFNWRVRRIVLGLNVKHQWAFDVIDVNYSNLRFGAHVGVVF